MQNMPSSIWNLFSGLPLIPTSKGDAELWLSRGELLLVIFAVVVVFGLFAEHWAEKSEKQWIPTPKRFGIAVSVSTWVVILAILGELFCDADIWVASDVLQSISDGEIVRLKNENLRLSNELARITMPRDLFFSVPTCEKVITDIAPVSVTIIWRRDVSDGDKLAHRIAECFHGGSPIPKWKVETLSAVEELPKDAAATGITVLADSFPDWWHEPKSAVDFAAKGIVEGMGRRGVTGEFSPSIPPDTIEIAIGPNLP